MPAVTLMGQKDDWKGKKPQNTKTMGAATVLVNGKPPHLLGQMDNKFHIMVKGSTTVIVEGKAITRMGDVDSNQNMNVEGSSNVIAN